MWKCTKCGYCCELFAPIIFGKECANFDKEKRTCNNYEQRPQICRTQLAKLLKKYGSEYESLKMEDYLSARCKLLKHLKKWKEETPESPLLHKKIMTACATAKLL